MSQQKAYGNTYTRHEFLNDVFDYVWESTMAGSRPTRGERMMQTLMIDYLIDKSPIQENETGSGEKTSTLTERDRALLQYGLPDLSHHHNAMFSRERISEFDFRGLTGLSAPDNSENSADLSDTIYYLLKKSKNVLEKAVDEQSGDVKEQYEYLLLRLKKALKTEG